MIGGAFVNTVMQILLP